MSQRLDNKERVQASARRRGAALTAPCGGGGLQNDWKLSIITREDRDREGGHTDGHTHTAGGINLSAGARDLWR